MKRNTKAVLFGILTLVWTGIIFSFSLQPADTSGNLSGGILSALLAWLEQFTGIVIPIDTVHNLFRKMAHFAEFFLLGLLAGSFFGAIRRPLFWGLLYSAVIGVTDEILQFFTGEGRAMRISDMLLDTSGALFAMVLLWLFGRLWAKKRG